jgi:hypothetical protein
MTIIDAAGTGWAVAAYRTLPATISHLRQVLGDEEFEAHGAENGGRAH